MYKQASKSRNSKEILERLRYLEKHDPAVFLKHLLDFADTHLDLTVTVCDFLLALTLTLTELLSD